MQHEQKKIALFVDFDNIYLGLRETSREAADAFATRPGTWLKWIEHGMQLDRNADRSGPRENRVLIRRCYLNPDTFGKYRGYFTHSGFTVVDCPSLTTRGKNSSDIVMVMDILDALRHETHFDRFVIMSADADFTPVLQRLRAHDRRTAVLVSGQAAPAYRAACDRLITEDQFIELALEMPATPEPQRPAAVPASPSAGPAASGAIRDPELLAAIGRRVYEEASSTGTLSASELPRILREFKEFTPSSNWLGYYSLQNLAEAVLAHRPELRITDDDPWRIAVQGAEEPAAPATNGASAAPAQQPGAEWGPIRDRVVERVSRMVAESAEPVVMGKAAHVAIQEAGPLITETRWLGKGTFKSLLLSMPDLPFRVVASPLPGYLYDPARHADPRERAAVDGLAEMEGEMASLVRRIHQLTDAPRLTPRQYRVLWEVIAKEITRAPYSLMSTGKAVRDQCVERGEPIARQSITLVLRGLSYAGYRFWDPPHRPDNLAYTYRGNLLNLLRQAQVTLSDDELRTLDDWLMGPIAEEPHEPSRQPAAADASASPAAAADGADAGPPSPAEPASVSTMDEQPAAGSTGDADATPGAHPVEAVEPDFASADALPARESHRPEAAESDTVPADWQPATDATSPVAAPVSADAAAPESPGAEPVAASADDGQPAAEAGPPADDGGSADAQVPDAPPPVAETDPELADAIPAELSDDHGPAGPDEVIAEWEMSDEPPAAIDPQSSEPSDAPPTAEAPVASAPQKPADAAAPADPPSDSAGNGDIFTPFWEPADGTTPESATPPAPADVPPPIAADAPPSEPVTPHFEVVGQDGQAAGASADPQPPGQMDAFPSDPPHAEGTRNNESSAPGQVPAEVPAAPKDDQSPQQPLW